MQGRSSSEVQPRAQSNITLTLSRRRRLSLSPCRSAPKPTSGLVSVVSCERDLAFDQYEFLLTVAWNKQAASVPGPALQQHGGPCVGPCAGPCVGPSRSKKPQEIEGFSLVLGGGGGTSEPRAMGGATPVPSRSARPARAHRGRSPAARSCADWMSTMPTIGSVAAPGRTAERCNRTLETMTCS